MPRPLARGRVPASLINVTLVAGRVISREQGFLQVDPCIGILDSERNRNDWQTIAQDVVGADLRRQRAADGGQQLRVEVLPVGRLLDEWVHSGKR